MPEAALKAEEIAFLRQCPQRVLIVRGRRAGAQEQRKLEMIQRLLQRRMLRGAIDAVASTRELLVYDLTLTPTGRAAVQPAAPGGNHAA